VVPLTRRPVFPFERLGEGGGMGDSLGTLIVYRFGAICLSQAGHQAMSKSIVRWQISPIFYHRSNFINYYHRNLTKQRYVIDIPVEAG